MSFEDRPVAGSSGVNVAGFASAVPRDGDQISMLDDKG